MISRKWQNILINWSIEFLPIIIFFILLAFVGNTENDFILATGIFTVTTVIALFVAYIREQRIAIFAAFAGIFIVGFGVATVIFHDPHIFMIKDTAYNGTFALILLPGLLMGRGYLRYFFTGLFDLTDRGWFLISLHYFILFVVIAVVNELIWRHYPQSIWILNKYVASAITFGLGFAEIPVGKKHRKPGTTGWGVRTTSKSDKEVVTTIAG